MIATTFLAASAAVAAAALAPPAQDPSDVDPAAPPTSAPPSSTARERPPISGTVEGAALIANGAMVTLSFVEQLLVRRIEGAGGMSAEQQIELTQRIVDQLVVEELRIQAGRDMGLDPALVQRVVDEEYDLRTDRLGLLEHAEALKESGLDPAAARVDLTDAIYQYHWVNSNIGRAPGGGGRVYRDRFVRPGEMYALYKERPEQFGAPDRVTLQRLVILGAQTGGLDEARLYAAELREQVLDEAEPADLGALVDEYDGRERTDADRANRGIGPPLPLDRLLLQAELDWARDAEVGELSPVLPWASPEQPERIPGFQIVRLVAREPGPPPEPFTSRGLQERIRTVLERDRQTSTLERSDRRLRREAFVWTYRVGARSGR